MSLIPAHWQALVWSHNLYKAIILLALLFAGLPSYGSDFSILTVTSETGQEDYSIKLQILLLMTALSFLPAALLMMTSFTRIIIVLSITRQALGLQQTPPNRVLVGIALALSFAIMRPVYTDIYNTAYLPYESGEVNLTEAFQTAEPIMKDFMLAQTHESTLAQMMTISKLEPVDDPAEIPFSVTIAAFVLSELKTAMQFGFMIFIPFLVIDLVVASVLMAMGMMMLSPLIISLPFKIIVFVLVDGWAMLAGSLAASY